MMLRDTLALCTDVMEWRYVLTRFTIPAILLTQIPTRYRVLVPVTGSGGRYQAAPYWYICILYFITPVFCFVCDVGHGKLDIGGKLAASWPLARQGPNHKGIH